MINVLNAIIENLKKDANAINMMNVIIKQVKNKFAMIITILCKQMSKHIELDWIIISNFILTTNRRRERNAMGFECEQQ